MPTVAERKEDLKKFALSIVRAQTNTYVKELLREHDVRIGATKEDFDKNLIEAIDKEVLTREHFEKWLQQIEGWGQQHVYAYRITREMQEDFNTEQLAHQQVRDARLARFWHKPTTTQNYVMEFPEDEGLHLASITYTDSLRLHWYKGTKYWVRTKQEEVFDKPNQWIDGFEYKFRAYRGRSMREVMRFEIRPDDNLAALFIPKPVNSKAHVDAYYEAKATIEKIIDFSSLERQHLLVGNIIKNLDQELTFNNTASERVSPQSTRLRSGGAYVEFAAMSQEGSYFDSSDIKSLRETLRTNSDIDPFSGEVATFRFSEDLGRVQLFANDNRIRLWSSLTADKVWQILRLLAVHQ